MSDNIKLPKAKTHKSPKVGREEFARWVVNKQIADQLPETAPVLMLDLVISLRHTRQLYQEMADVFSNCTIDPNAFEQYLTPDAAAALTSNTRAIVKDLIKSNALLFNKSLAKMIATLDEALSMIDFASTDFVEKMDERIFGYGNEQV